MRNVVLVLPLVALSACQLAPPHVRPEPPIADQYPASTEEERQSGVGAANLGWREFFVDPRLEILIDSALVHNRDLAVAVAQIDEARGLYRIERTNRLPAVSVNAEASRSRGASSAPAASGAESIAELYTIGAALSAFELDFWGRVRNLSAAARAQYLASVEAASAFRRSLIRDVASAYLTVLESSERIELAAATLQSRQDALRIAQRRLEAGVTSELEFRQAETLQRQAEADLAALRLSKAKNESYLTVLVGASVDESLPKALPLAAQSTRSQIAVGLPSELLEARPDILAAENRLRAARANIGAARAAYFPSISLTGSYGYASTELDDLVGDGGLAWHFGPSISVPLFDFGRRRGNLAVAGSRERIAVANYEKAIQTAFQEVSDALAGRRLLAEQVAAQERGTIAQRRLAELAQLRYQEGVISYLEVLDAERNLFTAEQLLLQLRRAEAINLVTLYIALGGGS
ncbi:MAG: efflux transporter outer membrane subunit [Pseudomonadales bacterium]|nr:efflux transporter outer membrane subunit [Pseudomonadales bacterium]